MAKGEPYLELLFELVGVAHPVGVAAPKGWLTGKRMHDRGCERVPWRVSYGVYHDMSRNVVKEYVKARWST